jgi:hypothetical protein
MTLTSKSARSILRMEAIGFTLMLVIVWLAELTGLPNRFFGDPTGFLWTRVLARTGVILAIWAWVHFTTRRLLRRLHELEGFLLVCSWCRRVGDEKRWVSMEEYFGSRLATETSHGICPDCSSKQLEAHRAAVRVMKQPKTPG